MWNVNISDLSENGKRSRSIIILILIFESGSLSLISFTISRQNVKYIQNISRLNAYK